MQKDKTKVTLMYKGLNNRIIASAQMYSNGPNLGMISYYYEAHFLNKKVYKILKSATLRNILYLFIS